MAEVKRKRILLVEDEVIIALSESKQLEKEGYAVLLAHSGEEAVQVFSNSGEEVDLVLMDINLGKGIDGTEAARRILALKTVPIVFLTSHAEREYVDRVKEITRYGYVVKNSSDFVLKSSIEMAFELFETNTKLVEKEERLAFALDGANDGFWDVDMASGNVYLSKRSCELLGYKEDQCVQDIRTWQELVCPDDMPATQAALDAYLEGREEIFTVEQRLRTKSGEYKWILARGKAVSHDANGKPVRMVGTHTDISERRKVEAKLYEKNALFQALLENSPIYVFFKDHNIRATYLSRNYEKMLGMPLEQILGKDMNELFPSDLAKAMIEDDKRIVNEGKLVTVEETLGDKSYTTVKFPIQLENAKPMLAGFTIDITDLRREEKELQLMSEIIKKLTQGVQLAGVGDGKIVYVNEAYEAMFGYGSGELLGRHVSVLNADSEKKPEEVAAGIIGELAKSGYWSGELVNVKKDGTLFWTRSVISSIRHPYYGEMWLTVQEDITESRRQQEKIKLLLAEKEIILKESHHRIKNNMNTIAGLLSLQAASLTEPAAVEALQGARDRLNSMMLLYDKLYRSEKVFEVSAKEYLSELTDEIMENLSRKEPVTLVKEIEDFTVSGATMFYVGIIVNELMTNAVKYAFHPGMEGRIIIQAGKRNGIVTIAVADNGKGFPTPVATKTVKGSGLSLVSLLVSQINGSFRLESGKGTKGIIEFRV